MSDVFEDAPARPKLELSPDQQRALDHMLAWSKAPAGDLTLGGWAGTGKSTLLRCLIDAVGPRAHVMAPTGRAAQVLRRKGVQCSTCHSIVYDFNGVYEDARGREQISWRDKEDVILPDFWVCDEASMVSGDLCDAIRAHKVPVIWIGDHAQLEPVGSDPGLMRDPMIKLEKIHRQAEGSSILAVAHDARRGLDPKLGDDGVVTVRRRGALQPMVERWIADGVQVACGRNATRKTINLFWRMALGHKSRLVVGERLICLYNSRAHGVYNGTMMRVLAVKNETEHGWTCDVEDDGGALRTLNLWSRALAGGDWTSADKPKDHVVVDFSYAITVHKSQGSEFDRFAVVDEPAHSWDHARHRYTAFTRAKTRLYIHL